MGKAERKRCILIPMRGGSKGIPRKNLIEFEGKPLLHHVLVAAINSGVGQVFVSTEDPEIKEECLRFEGVTVIDRPQYLALDESTDWEVFDHFIEIHPDFDYIIHLRATWPRITPKIIENAVQDFEEWYDTCTSMRSVEKATEIPWKMWYLRGDDLNGQMKPVVEPKGAGWKWERHSQPRQNLPQAYYQNAAIDIIKTSTIRRGSTVGDRPRAYIMDGMIKDGVDIDTEKDIK